MKTFSFIAGHPKDASRGMMLQVDRSQLPANMKLAMLLDDDGRAIPGFQRPGAKGHGDTELVLLERTRVRAKIAGRHGVLTLEPGSRFDAAPENDLGAVEVEGGRVVNRGGRRYAEFERGRATLHVDKKPNAAHVLTLVAEKPPGARPGDRFLVEVTQTSRSGERQGAVAVVFTFD